MFPSHVLSLFVSSRLRTIALVNLLIACSFLLNPSVSLSSVRTNEPTGSSVPLTASATATSVSRNDRSLPLGEAYDVVLPSSLPLGIILDKDLYITSFRSPIEEQHLQEKLDKLRAKASVAKGSLSMVASASTAGTVSPSSLSSTVVTRLNDQLTLSYSLAEYTGIIKIGDKLIAINNEPVWKLSLPEVVPLLAVHSTVSKNNGTSPTGRSSTRTITFLRPLRSRTLKEWSTTDNPSVLPSSTTSLPYARYIRKVAQSLSHTRSPSSSTLSVQDNKDQALTYSVTIRNDQFIGALFSKDFVLLSTNPMDTERFYAVLQNESISSSSTATLQISRLPPSVAIALLLCRGQLSGKAWAGDKLIAINGETVSAINGIEQLYAALDIPILSTVTNHQDMILPLHSRLKNYSNFVNDTDTVNLFSGDTNNRDDNTNDVICIGSGYYCISTNDIDNVQALSVLTTLQAKQYNASYNLSSHQDSSSNNKVILTFERASYLPIELLPSSRYGAITNALYRLTQNSSAPLTISSRTSSILSTLSSDRSSVDNNDNGAEINGISVTEEFDQLITSSFTCYNGRCSFRAADRVYLRTKSMTSSRVLSTTSSAVSDDDTKDKPKKTSTADEDEEEDPDDSRAVSIRKNPKGVRNETNIHERNEIFTIGVPALFGGAYSCLSRPVVYAYPSDGCSRLKTSKGGQDGPPPSYAGAIVLVERGTCTFPQKALQIQSAGGSAMIVINTDNSPPIAMPGNQAQGKISSMSNHNRPKTEEQLKAEKQGLHRAEDKGSKNTIAHQVDDTNVAIAACMITKEAGQVLKDAINDGRKDGYTTSGSFITSINADYDLCHRKKKDGPPKDKKSVASPPSDSRTNSHEETSVWNTTSAGEENTSNESEEINDTETIDPHELARILASLSLGSSSTASTVTENNDSSTVQWIDLSSLTDRFESTVLKGQVPLPAEDKDVHLTTDGDVETVNDSFTNNNNGTFVMV